MFLTIMICVLATVSAFTYVAVFLATKPAVKDEPDFWKKHPIRTLHPGLARSREDQGYGD